MKEDKKKIMILVILILILIIVFIIIEFIIYKINKNRQMEKTDKGDPFALTTNSNIESVTTNLPFYNIENCANNFISYLHTSNNQVIYNLLDKNYITSNNITENNVLEKLAIRGNYYYISDMQKKDINLNFVEYFTSGALYDENYKLINNQDFTISVDYEHNTYSVIPENLSNDTSSINTSITTNSNNSFNNFNITDEEIIQKYFTYFKNMAINNSNVAFSLVEENYKSKSFNNSLNNFNNYLNSANLKNASLVKYSKKILSDSNYKTEYVGVDNLNNYYTFEETKPMNFVVKFENPNNGQDFIDISTNDSNKTNSLSPTRISRFNEFFTLNRVAINFISAVKNKSAELLMSYFSQETINDNGLNSENITKKINTYNNQNTYRTKAIYFYCKNGYYEYYLNGYIDSKDIYIIIGVDTENSTFDITPITKTQFNEYISGNKYSNIDFSKTISKKDYNEFKWENYDNDEIVKEYIAGYTGLMLNNEADAYSLLEDETKNSKFSNESTFVSFIKNNKEKISAINILNSPTADNPFSSSSEYYKYYDQHESEKMSSNSIEEGTNNSYKLIKFKDKAGDQFLFYINIYNPGDYKVGL